MGGKESFAARLRFPSVTWEAPRESLLSCGAPGARGRTDHFASRQPVQRGWQNASCELFVSGNLRGCPQPEGHGRGHEASAERCREKTCARGCQTGCACERFGDVRALARLPSLQSKVSSAPEPRAGDCGRGGRGRGRASGQPAGMSA